jgi:hypothetical protein
MAQLFESFEINRVPRWPLMSRLVALSVVAHGLFFVAVAYVPKLQSLFAVAGSLAGIKVVDQDYDKTLIGQRATLIRVGEPYEKLYYPTDYFGAPPLDPALDPMLVQNVSAPPPPPPPVFRTRPVHVPRPTPTPSPEPSPSPAASPSPEVASQTEEEKKQAEEELNKIAKENNVERPPGENEMNVRPLKDVLERAKQMLAEGKLDLKDTIEVTVEADRKADGSLENVVFKDPKGDPDAYTLAQEFVTALSASKALVFLKDTRHMVMALKLDQQDVFVSVTTEADTELRAAQMSLGYGTMIAIVRRNKKGTDEGQIFDNMQVSSDGKQVLMKFQMSRDVAAAMLSKVRTTE